MPVVVITFCDSCALLISLLTLSVAVFSCGCYEDGSLFIVSFVLFYAVVLGSFYNVLINFKKVKCTCIYVSVSVRVKLASTLFYFLLGESIFYFSLYRPIVLI